MNYNQGYYLHEKSNRDLNIVLTSAVELGEIDKAKYIINLPNFQNDELYPYYLNDCLGEACIRGYFEFVKYLLTSNELKMHADISYSVDTPLVNACEHGHLNIVQYLLTSPELEKHADIHAQAEEPILIACVSQHVHIIKYLLNSDDLYAHSNIQNKDGLFFYYCLHEPTKERMEMMNFAIFEKNIPKNDIINKYLQRFPNKEVENMFLVRDMKDELNKDLKNHASNPKIKTKKI